MTLKRWHVFVVLLPWVLALAACGDDPETVDEAPAAVEPDDPEDADDVDDPDDVADDPEDAVELSAVGYVDRDHILDQGLIELINVLDESGADVRINYVGGPEVIPTEELGDAVRTGAMDMGLVAPGFIADIIPEALAFPRSELTIEEEVETGAIEFANQFFVENDIWLVGRASTGDFLWFLRDPIESADDFRGVSLRGTAGYAPLIEELDAEFVTLPPGEVYTALDRGVIDGFPFPRLGTVDLSLHEQICCIIEPGWWHVDIMLIMNLDAWNSLSDSQQAQVMDAMAEAQSRLVEINSERQAEEEEVFAEHGIEFVDLGEEFSQRMSDASWRWMHDEHGDAMDVDALEEAFRR